MPKFYDENMRPDHMNNFAFKPGVRNFRTLPLIPVNPNHMPQVSANNILRIPNQAIKGRPGNKETNVSYQHPRMWQIMQKNNGNDYGRPQLPIIEPNLPMQYQDRDSFGEALYPIVASYTNELIAGKVTEMILNLGIPVVTMLMNDRQTLKEKILDAVETLRTVWKDIPAQFCMLPNSHL